MIELASDREPGQVITFYSFKGGVGRSMALANVAALLAAAGRKVLVIDWDLEAPGLDRYFQRYVAAAEKDGIVELVTAFADKKPIGWRSCVVDVTIPRADRQSGRPLPTIALKLIRAGRFDDTYGKRVRALRWEELFTDHKLGRYLEDMRTEWIAEFDYVLIDSRTGITDAANICTIHLPDVIVALFAPNWQNINGVKRVLDRALVQHSELPVDRTRLRRVPVPTREDRAEKLKTDAWRETAAKMLGDFYLDWLPADQAPLDAMRILKVPQVPFWSYGEELPVIDEGTDVPDSIGFAYGLLTSLLDSKLSWAALGDGKFAFGGTRTASRADTSRRRTRLVVGAATIAVCAAIGVLMSRSCGRPRPTQIDAAIALGHDATGSGNVIRPDAGLDAGTHDTVHELAMSGVAVVALGDQFWVTSSSPTTLIRVDPSAGALNYAVDALKLDGLPLAIAPSADQKALYVGIEYVGVTPPAGNGALVRLDLKSMQFTTVPIQADATGEHGERLSSLPISIADDGKLVWIATNGGPWTPAVFVVQGIAQGKARTRHYEPTVPDHDIGAVQLAAAGGLVLALAADKTSSIFRFTESETFWRVDGTIVPFVGCMSAIASSGDHLVGTGCKNEVFTLRSDTWPTSAPPRVSDPGHRQGNGIPAPQGLSPLTQVYAQTSLSRDRWRIQRIASDGERTLLVFVDTAAGVDTDGSTLLNSVIIDVPHPGARGRELIRGPFTVVSLAVTGDHAIVIRQAKFSPTVTELYDLDAPDKTAGSAAPPANAPYSLDGGAGD